MGICRDDTGISRRTSGEQTLVLFSRLCCERDVHFMFVLLWCIPSRTCLQRQPGGLEVSTQTQALSQTSRRSSEVVSREFVSGWICRNSDFHASSQHWKSSQGVL